MDLDYEWKIDPESTAEKVFRSFPLSAQEMRCTCVNDEPYYRLAWKNNRDEWDYDEDGRWLHTCGKTSRYLLVNYIKECESCERWFYPPAEGKPYWHAQYGKLCPGCISKIPVRPRRRRQV